MKVLVTGANGQLGWELCERGTKHGFDIVPLDLPEFDISDPALVNKGVSQADVSLVINAAAYTAVDRAETELESAFPINRDGPAIDKIIEYINFLLFYVRKKVLSLEVIIN